MLTVRGAGQSHCVFGVVFLGGSMGVCRRVVAFWIRFGGEQCCVLQTEQLEGKMGLEREPSECLGDVGGPASTQYRDDEISQGGHDAWSSSGPYL